MTVVASIVIATNNRGKFAELELMLQSCALIAYPQQQFQLKFPPETGTTFAANALAKAEYAVAQTGETAVGDDSGLEVDFLGGAPGILSARYAGENATAADNRAKLLTALKGVPREKRTARFKCALAMAAPPGDFAPIICEGVWEGRIAEAAAGDGGFGYDAIFYINELNKTAAQLTAAEKNKISHRAATVEKLRKRYLGDINF